MDAYHLSREGTLIREARDLMSPEIIQKLEVLKMVIERNFMWIGEFKKHAKVVFLLWGAKIIFLSHEILNVHQLQALTRALLQGNI